MDAAVERVISGPERKSRVISDEELEIIAFHEIGHAMVGHVLPHTDPIHKVSIISRGRALGYTLSLPEDDKVLNSKQEMLDQMAMLLGGRVAEEIAVGEIYTGASNDIERATKIAKQMVTRFGMSDKLGPQTFGDNQSEVFLGRDFAANPDYSQEVAYEIDKEIRKMIDDSFQRAHSILSERKEQLELATEVLLERETVDGKALDALLAGEWDEFLVQEAANKSDDTPEDLAASEEDSAEPAEEGEADKAGPEAPGVPPAISGV
jgi:cell division protease FtsH